MITPIFRKIDLKAYKPGKSFLSKKKKIIKTKKTKRIIAQSKFLGKGADLDVAPKPALPFVSF